MPRGEVYLVWYDWYSETTVESIWDTEEGAVKERDRLAKKYPHGASYVVSVFTLNVPDGPTRTIGGDSDAAR